LSLELAVYEALSSRLPVSTVDVSRASKRIQYLGAQQRFFLPSFVKRTSDLNSCTQRCAQSLTTHPC
jgi:hypothetical protein